MSKFSNHEILPATYKTVGNTPITLDVILPSQIPAGHRAPVIIRFHGGGWVTGSSLYEPWFAPWILDLATAHNAIIVSPNYQLLPESNGMDIMSDLDSIWEWVHAEEGLAATLRTSETEGVEPDLERIFTTGDSAGGYLSIQLALSHSKQIRACSAMYPGIDFQSPPFSAPFPAPFGPPLPANFVKSHLATAAPGGIVSSDDKLERFPLIFAMMQHGTFRQYLGTEPLLYAFERIKNGEELPPLFVLHGSEDKVAPLGGSERLVELWRGMKLDAKIVLEVVEAGEHGCDTEWRMDNEALAAGLELMVEEWLR